MKASEALALTSELTVPIIIVRVKADAERGFTSSRFDEANYSVDLISALAHLGYKVTVEKNILGVESLKVSWKA